MQRRKKHGDGSISGANGTAAEDGGGGDGVDCLIQVHVDVAVVVGGGGGLHPSDDGEVRPPSSHRSLDRVDRCRCAMYVRKLIIILDGSALSE